MTTPSKNVLMVMPNFPSPEVGAERMERAEGIRQLVRLGYDVTVIAKTSEWINKDVIHAAAQEMGVRLIAVPYKFSNRTLSIGERLVNFIGRLRNPLYIDGAAYEYSESEIKKVFAQQLEERTPAFVWFEYTYLWPLYGAARARGIPVITRSQNFEPQHFLEEDGRSPLNYLKYVAKRFGERRMARYSDAVLAITPKEDALYKKLGTHYVATLPLRQLARVVTLPKVDVRSSVPLHMFFMGSSYTVAHNRAALMMVVRDIAPLIQQKAPGEFVIHVLGAKMPDAYKKYFDGRTVVHEGFVADLDTFLATMDIALIPSLMGAGMQQKVFEPLARGIPTVTSSRAIAGYPFEAGSHYLDATTPAEFVDALLTLRDLARRNALRHASASRARELFSRERLDTIVKDAITHTCQK